MTSGDTYEDVERLICEYMPTGYAPEPTHITGELIPSHPALLPARKPGRPHGPRDVAADALLSHCADLPIDADGYARTTNASLADGLNISVAYVRLLLRELRASGRIDARPEARTLALRLIYDEGAFNYHPASQVAEGVNQLGGEGVNLPREGVNFPYPDRIATRNDAGSGYMENTPPPVLPGMGAGTADVEADRRGVFSCPAPAPHVVQTAPEPVATPAPTWTLLQCDRIGYPTTYGVCWKARGPDGTCTDVCDHQDEAAFWARRRWGCLPVVAPEPQPAPEQPHDGSEAYGEDFAAHDEKTTSQDGSGATEQTTHAEFAHPRCYRPTAACTAHHTANDCGCYCSHRGCPQRD